MLDTQLAKQLCPSLTIYGNMIYNEKNNKSINMDLICEAVLKHVGNNTRNPKYIAVFFAHAKDCMCYFIKEEHCEITKFLEILEIYQNERRRLNREPMS